MSWTSVAWSFYTTVGQFSSQILIYIYIKETKKLTLTRKKEQTSSIVTNVMVPWLSNMQQASLWDLIFLLLCDILQQSCVVFFLSLHRPTVWGSCSVVVTIPKPWLLKLPRVNTRGAQGSVFLCNITPCFNKSCETFPFMNEWTNIEK